MHSQWGLGYDKECNDALQWTEIDIGKGFHVDIPDTRLSSTTILHNHLAHNLEARWEMIVEGGRVKLDR